MLKDLHASYDNRMSSQLDNRQYNKKYVKNQSILCILYSVKFLIYSVATANEIGLYNISPWP